MIEFFPLLKKNFQKVIKTFENLTVSGNAEIAGDLTVGGTVHSVDVQTVQSENDYIITRFNNPLELADGDYSGIKINNYDGEGANLNLVVDNEGWAQVGNDNDLQRLATIDTPTANAIPYYDADTKTLKANTAGVNDIWKGTQSEYNAIATKDANTLYIIIS